MKGLLDTSVFVAREGARGLAELPDEPAISVMTIAELHVGVLMADTPDVRAQRLATLSEVERTFDPLPVDTAVARRFARLVAHAQREGTRPEIVDTLVAATAAVHELPVYTQDDDFCAMPGVDVVLV